MRKTLTLLALAAAMIGQANAGTTVTPTTTLTAETSNNTSTADSFQTQTNGNLGATNISKLSIKALLPAGSTTKVYAHVMPWFGTSSHMDIGYRSADVAQVRRQIADMKSRGIDGAILYWSGRPLTSQRTNHDNVAKLYMQEAEAQGFEFAIQPDKTALQSCAATSGCSMTNTLIQELNYAAATFYGSPAYMRRDGRPVVPFFGLETYTTIDWNAVNAGVQGNPKFIFRNSVGFEKTQSDGAFAWIGTSTDTDLAGLSYLRNFYSKATGAYAAMETFGSTYPGFDDTLASWGKNRIVPRRCGKTWLETFATIRQYYPNGNLESLQLNTWNDFEEGSEIESGIDNCVSVAASVSGTTLQWTLSGDPNTVAAYNVFISTDGENLMKLATVPVGTTSLDLAPYALAGGSYTLYVQAYGQPMMTNKMSGAVSFTVAQPSNVAPVAVLSATPITGKAPLVVSVASNSTDADGTVASTSFDMGNGTVLSAAGAHTYGKPGIYDVVLTVTDNRGATAAAAQTVTVLNNDPVARLTLSATSGPASLSVTANAGASSDVDGTIVKTVLDFGDGYVVNAASATRSYTKAGTYTVRATVTDNLGATSTTTSTVTVVNTAPRAAISVTPTSGSAPLTVNISSAASTDADGAIVTSKVDFGNGVVVNGSSASYTYTVPGTYTVKVTVTDNMGASSTATSTVTVKQARRVRILSPSASSTVSSPARVTAVAESDVAIRSGKIYVDGVGVFAQTASTTSSTMNFDTYLRMAAGQRRITVQVWDANGIVTKSTVYVTVK